MTQDIIGIDLGDPNDYIPDIISDGSGETWVPQPPPQATDPLEQAIAAVFYDLSK